MKLTKLQERLAYQFKNPVLLQRAVTHRSHGSEHNERLEFLGDSILNFSIAQMLFEKLKSVPEGDLSRIRASLVKQDTLAQIAISLGMSDFIRLGEGELKSGGFRRPSILADAMEAIFAAVYLDSDMPQVQSVIAKLYAPLLENVDFKTMGKDAKTLLQELLQAHKYELPVYNVINTSGAAHDQQFEVECLVPALEIQTIAEGTTRRGAEQEAAALAIVKVQEAVVGHKVKRRTRKVRQLTLPVATEQREGDA